MAGGVNMKSGKNCCGCGKNSKSKSTKNRSGDASAQKHEKSSSKSEADPDGSYTGNPVGWGKNAMPVQDVDDL